MSEDIIKSIKCAIYTRKSTDEELEKEFNTLEAQREAGQRWICELRGYFCSANGASATKIPF